MQEIEAKKRYIMRMQRLGACSPCPFCTALTCLNVKNILGLDFKLPTIKVKEGKIIGYDPDSPTNDHFCLPQCDNYPLKEGEYLDFKGDEEIDYGPAKFVKGIQFAKKRDRFQKQPERPRRPVYAFSM
jgi:hypothetical protein